MDEHTNSGNIPVAHQSKLKKRLKIFAIVFVLIILSAVGVGFAYGRSFEHTVFPGVHVDSYDIGGMDMGELQKFIGDMHTKLLGQGIPVTFDLATSSGTFLLSPQLISDDAVIEFIDIDPELSAQKLISFRKTGNIFFDSLQALLSHLTKPSVVLDDIVYQKEKIFDEIDYNMSAHITPPTNAGVDVRSVSPLKYSITSSSRGVSFEYEDIFDEITESWSRLEQPIIHIETREVDPTIVESDVERIIDSLPRAFSVGALSLLYTNSSTKRDYSWKITPAMISRWITVEKDDSGAPSFSLSSPSVRQYLEDVIAPVIEVSPQDAKFAVGENNKVSEFQGSHPGITLDIESTRGELMEVFASRFVSSTNTTSTQSLTLTTIAVEPKIKTGDVNDLGITEVLGVGKSVFKGSPGNRYKNIRHAAFDKLDGLIIKPGEEFSLLEALKPFTISGGYLPELAIKGDRLVPEIGGGLCQIGTTMFRAAMNAGLEITERRNHSLMISYYNDLTNGLPGTDATIYDPGTDFKFKNDTGHHILITSELVDSTGDLYFTLWGTSDGRKGYYIPPTLVRRIPVGPTRIVETTELPAGKKECQHAYPGAEAYFTYVREMPDGEKKEVVYSSYYRPLPEICLVGVEKPAEAITSEGEQTSNGDQLLQSGDEVAIPLES